MHLYSYERLQTARGKWRITLTGKILGRPIEFDHLTRTLSRKWNSSGNIEEIVDMNFCIYFPIARSIVFYSNILEFHLRASLLPILSSS